MIKVESERFEEMIAALIRKQEVTNRLLLASNMGLDLSQPKSKGTVDYHLSLIEGEIV